MKTLNEDIRDYLSPYEAHLTEKQRMWCKWRLAEKLGT